eukprot:TRINITY_DN5250_c0_g1_i2.p8 TRINITY_DN5250_c0_g1~~TRINITY_DN5250_c0_g1_i2.p8  ORF type:complete len:133 (+),score=48.04 TRINITY_DN5250_c0_g1_i2:594-992(+)
MFAPKFDVTRFKVNVKLALTRMKLQKNKKANWIIAEKRAVAEELAKGNEEQARIKVETVIKEDFCIESYDLLELYLEEVATQIKLIDNLKVCPQELKEAVCTLVYASSRVQIAEFLEVGPVSSRSHQTVAHA